MKLRQRVFKPIQHFPLFQTVFHISFFCELRAINNFIENLVKEFHEKSQEIITKFYSINGLTAAEKDSYIKEIQNKVDEYMKAKKRHKKIIGELRILG